MLYIAFAKNRPQSGPPPDLGAKSRKWWNDGDKPAGLKTVAFYGAVGSNTPAVIVFEADRHEDIRTMIQYWHELEFEVHPALDLAALFRQQGMRVA